MNTSGYRFPCVRRGVSRYSRQVKLRNNVNYIPSDGYELHPKSFVSNFWGAVQNYVGKGFNILIATGRGAFPGTLPQKSLVTSAYRFRPEVKGIK